MTRLSTSILSLQFIWTTRIEVDGSFDIFGRAVRGQFTLLNQISQNNHSQTDSNSVNLNWLTIQLRSTTLDYITGFHMLDGQQHLLVLEGTAEGSIARIWEENPKTHDDFKVWS